MSCQVAMTGMHTIVSIKLVLVCISVNHEWVSRETKIPFITSASLLCTLCKFYTFEQVCLCIWEGVLLSVLEALHPVLEALPWFWSSLCRGRGGRQWGKQKRGGEGGVALGGGCLSLWISPGWFTSSGHWWLPLPCCKTSSCRPA